jgi:hypothetical protein
VQPSSPCPDCGRPIAGDDTDVDNVHCFKRFDPHSADRSDFEVTCLRLAVARRSHLRPVEHSDFRLLENDALRCAREHQTLRAQFAAQALQGLLAYRPYLNCHEEPALTAPLAVRMADALLKELGYEVPS